MRQKELFGRNGKKERLYDYREAPAKSRPLLLWTVLLIILLIAAAVVTVRITHVEVIGNHTYTSEEIEDMVFPDVWDRSTLICLVKERTTKHRSLPFIEDYRIRITGPFSCELIVYEKSIVGYINYMSSFMYFDKDGVVVENSTQRISGVPEIIGLSFGHIVLNQPLPVADERVFNEIMSITQQLGLYGIGSEAIQFDNLGQITLRVDNGAIEVSLGSYDEMDAKLSALRDMLPSIEERGLSGTLDLSNYSDSDTNQVYSFRIREEQTDEAGTDAEAGAGAQADTGAGAEAGSSEDAETGVETNTETDG